MAAGTACPIFSFLSRLQPYLDNTHSHFQQVISPTQHHIQTTANNLSIAYCLLQRKVCLLLNMIEMYNSKLDPRISPRTAMVPENRVFRQSSRRWIVTGEETEDNLPIGNSPEIIAKRESYEKRQALATTAILLSCNHEVSTYLSGITDPKAMWDTLAEQLSSASSSGRRVTIGKNFEGR